MKIRKFLIILVTLCISISVKTSLYAQDDEELSEEEWQKQMDDLMMKKNEMMTQINSLNQKADSLNEVRTEKETEFERELDLLYWWVDATKSDVADFRKTFESAEKIINSKSGTKEEQLKKLEEIGASKIKCLPEFWDRYQKMKKKTDKWDNEGGAHKLMRGDCLLNIMKIKQCCREDINMWSTILKAKKAFNKNAMDIIPGKAMKVLK